MNYGAPPQQAGYYQPPYPPPQYYTPMPYAYQQPVPQYMPYMPYPVIAPPRPRGPPARPLFYIGAAGMFVLAAAGILGGLVFFIAPFGYGYGRGYPFEIVITGVMVLISSVMAAVGYLGLYRNYGSGMGAASGIYLLIAASLFLVLTAGSIEYHSFGGYWDETGYGYYTPNIFMYWTGYIIFGVAPILTGTSHLVSRHHMTIPGLGVATGVLLIIGGAFLITLFLSFVGFFILTAGAICGGINFAKAPIYQMNMSPQG
ncbi:MAG: hypothetical protein FJ149_11340 [Euryarchaeota archaeon]|nr:hypothetical protein [Euryarchaeota archaeon]